MPEVSEWERRCVTLAKDIAAACAGPLQAAETRFEDMTYTMWASEEDARAVPISPIGLFHRYRVRERRTLHLFGIRWLPIRHWRTLLEFGMEELWGAPRWAHERGLWSVIHDPRAEAAARPLLERFAHDHLLGLEIEGTRKGP